ncbi:MAG: hypothetical protein ABR547_02030 [Halanaerobium sp.]
MEELKNNFEKLSDDEKIDFIKVIMPKVFKIVKNDPEKMQDMMLSCKSMMGEDMDMTEMMNMMKSQMNK